MANAEHLAILKEGVGAWNKWRRKNPNIRPDLSESQIGGMNLNSIDFRLTNLSLVNLSGADLRKSDMWLANVSGADLSNSDLREASLFRTAFAGTNLTYANLSNANLQCANLRNANLTHATLQNADLGEANFVESNLSYSDISGCKIFGVNVWGIEKNGIVQKSLKIGTTGMSTEIIVDDLEMAQFIYLLLDNQKFRDVIETITSKAVLILGRFTDERKQVLENIRDELRIRNFLPILFDFEKPATRDLTETISILAKLSRFVIADLTDAKSIPQELSNIVPHMPSLPVIPLILKEQREYGMFEHWRPYPWVLPIYEYENEGHLISTLSAGVIEPAERKVQEIRNCK